MDKHEGLGPQTLKLAQQTPPPRRRGFWEGEGPDQYWVLGPPADGSQHLRICHTVIIAEVPDDTIHELQWEVLDHAGQGTRRWLLIWNRGLG